jgi:formylmethanofuran dehydrogenase subunit E
LLRVGFSPDEEIVCVTENDACGVDAIQVILGCSVGKGNLLFRLRGKQAFSFFNRATGVSIRLVMKENPFERSGCANKIPRSRSCGVLCSERRDSVSVSLTPPTFLAKKSTPQEAGYSTRKRNKDDMQKHLFETAPEELFEKKDVSFNLPEHARIFRSVRCDKCGEKTAENYIRLEDGKKICEDCFVPYNRIF